VEDKMLIKDMRHRSFSISPQAREKEDEGQTEIFKLRKETR